ncbi:MAG: hypothetical protein ACPL7E_05170 [bacterium]
MPPGGRGARPRWGGRPSFIPSDMPLVISTPFNRKPSLGLLEMLGLPRFSQNLFLVNQPPLPKPMPYKLP